jgi:hypothetical protein
MLMRDPYAGHRNYEDPWWVPDPVRDTAWTEVDYALVEAAQTIESFTSSTSGQLRWLAEDPDVYWDTGETVDYATQQVARDSEKYKDGVPHEVTIFAKNPTKNGEFWTLEEWFDFLDRDEARVDRGAPAGARPPTSADRAAMRKAREERIAKALNPER